jgi:nitric oxide reductase activation protein
LVNELQSDQTLGLEHSDLEQIISREGNELLRRLLQGHLDLRAAREQKLEGVCGADGEDRTHCRIECERALMSLFGEVTVRRKGYSARGKDSVFR